MKTRILSFLISIISLSSIQNIDAQITTISKFSFDKTIPTTLITAPDLESIKIEDLQRDKNGELYRIGVARAANITTNNSGIWRTLNNGSRQWQLHVKSPGAEAISFLFERFIIYGGTTLNIQDLKGKMLHSTMTKNDVESHFMQNAALCFGDEMILTLTEPAYTTPSEIFIDRIMYNYRSTGNPNALKIIPP